MSKHAIIAALLASCVASGVYWSYRSGQAANETRLLEERARAIRMEAEIDRLKSELNAREDGARLRMIEQQQTVAAEQTQVATGLKSQDYAGIASDTYDLLNVENQKARIQRYLSDNSLVSTTMKAQQTAVQGITETATTMRSLLVQFAGRDLSAQSPQNITDVRDLQDKAFAAL